MAARRGVLPVTSASDMEVPPGLWTKATASRELTQRGRQARRGASPKDVCCSSERGVSFSRTTPLPAALRACSLVSHLEAPSLSCR